jgi:hypothetical protein
MAHLSMQDMLFPGTQFVVALFLIIMGEVGVNVVSANGT